MELTGKIESVSEAVTGVTKDGDNWAKRTIVVNDGIGQYPNRFVMNLFKKGEYVDYATEKFTYAVGDNVKIEYSVRANEYKDSWYGDNSIFRIEMAIGSSNTPPAQPPHIDSDDGDENDLPF